MNIKSKIETMTEVTKVLVVLAGIAILGIALNTKTVAQPVPGGSLLTPYAIVAGAGEWPARITNSVALLGTNHLDLSSAKDVCFEFTFKLDAAGTANAAVGIQQSVSGNKWETLKAFGKPANGTTEVTVVTNVTVNAARTLRLYITNAEATSMITGYSITINPK